MKLQRVFTALLSLFFTAQTVSADSYSFPIQDPFQATLLAPAAAIFKDLQGIRQKDICFNFFPERKELPFYGDRAKACTRLFYQEGEGFFVWKEKKKAPLVFILGGFGANEISETSTFLAEQLYKQGYHVLTVPSPFNWRFNMGALPSALPGAIKYDSQKIYKFMEKALNKAKETIEVSEIRLLGYSLGGLESLFIAKQDTREKTFNFKKIVAVNPPVDLMASAQNLDRYYDTYTKYTPRQQKILQDRVMSIAFKLIDQSTPKTFFNSLMIDFPFSPQHAEAIIGDRFYGSFAGSLVVTELVNDFGLFPTYPDHYSVMPALENAKKWTIERYTKEVLWPYYSKQFPEKSLEEFSLENSMISLKTFLEQKENVFIQHNVDDIILNEGDIEFIRETLKDRAFIFPRGGHMGNVWWEENIKLLIYNVISP